MTKYENILAQMAMCRKKYGQHDQTVAIYRGDDELELEVSYNICDGDFELKSVEHNGIDFDETTEEHDQIMDAITSGHDWDDDGGYGDYLYDMRRERSWDQ